MENPKGPYPANFEQKIGFDEIRSMLLSYCQSPLGRERVEAMTFSTLPSEIRERHRCTTEFAAILAETADVPASFADLRTSLHRLRIEGTHLEEQEMWQLY
ncbi:MAG: endonuclease MutS2, partial [Bacteroidaceae bacterium]|nr:endonuclease MutS2 [Bacteroidaceae bacterium]